MKYFLAIAFISFGFFSNAQINTLAPGQPAPEFELKNTDNKQVGFKDFPLAKGFILVFTCNTCPVARAYEERILELDKKYASKGYPVIAINPNDPGLSEGDSFVKMQERAQARGYTFPYLFDEGQKTTNAYGAKNTPHIFLVGKTSKGYTIEYTGAIDDDAQNNNPEKINYVDQAVSALKNNQKPSVVTTKAIGCRVKRKNS